MREAGICVRIGRQTVSSRQLGEALGVSDAQVRKDLALLGQFGQSGVGYDASALYQQLRQALGTDRNWNTLLVGAGNIGRALLGHAAFEAEGFKITAVFDSATSLVGTTIIGHRIRPMSELGSCVKELRVRIGIMAVPRDAAQVVADQLVRAGVSGLLNFASRRVELPDTVRILSVDFTGSLERLAFEIHAAEGGLAESA